MVEEMAKLVCKVSVTALPAMGDDSRGSLSSPTLGIVRIFFSPCC